MEAQSEATGPQRGQEQSYEHPGRTSSERRTDWQVFDLLRELGRESQALVRAEAELLRAEMSEKVAQAQQGIASMAGGVAVLFAGVVLLLSAAAIGLSAVMAAWLAFLVVGVLALIVGGALVGAGKKRVEPANLKPDRSIDEVRADRQFVKQRLNS